MGRWTDSQWDCFIELGHITPSPLASIPPRRATQELRQMVQAEQAQEAAAAAAAADDADLLAAAAEGMKEMSEKFKQSGAQLYH